MKTGVKRMKLIDIEDEVLWKNLSEGRRSAKQVVKLFMKQPIIEAVPIQFLKDWSEQYEYDATIPRTIPLVLSDWENWRNENE